MNVAVNQETPERSYQQRQSVHTEVRQKLVAADDRLALARGLMFIGSIVLVWLFFNTAGFSSAWPLLALVAFAILVVLHNAVARRLEERNRAIAYYTRRLDHMAGQWMGQGDPGQRYRDDDHPYSSDLDLFGKGSLFEYISGARTRLGQNTLADWFCSGASIEAIEARQSAIAELRDHLELIEQLAVLKTGKDLDANQDLLQRWCAGPADTLSSWQLVVATVLGSLALLSLALWGTGAGPIVLLPVILLELVFYSVSLRDLRRMAADAAAANSGLELLSEVMTLFEGQSFHSPLLQQLSTELECRGRRPSEQIARLSKLVDRLEHSLRNQLIVPIALLTCAPFQLMRQIDSWREEAGASIPGWFKAVGEMEALCSLARYAFENPDDPFPQLVADSEPALFRAAGLGHPLLPKEACIANDIEISNARRLIMVSGSNMSGKSTLLRTIGINSVLACCGAPVRATNLQTSRFQLGCVMRVSDSLQNGVSLFYSVISRIKRVVELTDKSPTLLFLFDEILQGTNSHDRRIGAEGITRQLIDKGAVGLITTHDLELTGIVASLGTTAVNIHFEDHLEDGQMRFDYKIRPGVVNKSNALELMRMVGLDVNSSSSE